MSPRKLVAGLLCLIFPMMASAAMVWSPCQTITAVTNYTAYSNSVSLALSPGIAGCSSDAAGMAYFRVGEVGVTADSLKSYFATALSAYLSGKRVMVLYDNSTAACFSNVVAVGGFSGQCN